MNLWNRILGLVVSEQWNIGISQVRLSEIMEEERVEYDVTWLPELRDGFLADPFVLNADVQNGPIWIMAEVFDYRTGLGRICALSCDVHTGEIELHEIPSLRLDVHMSYPYLIENEKAIFCIPETHQARSVFLYRAKKFPEDWEREAVLLRDFPAVDSTVFHYNGLWWLFCTNADEDPDAALYAWYAASLFGPWLPHANNPVKYDRESSRPAGRPFVYAGQLYRPGQDCSDTYGGRTIINRVVRLSPTEFQEELVRTIGPQKPYSRGLHTIAFSGHTMIIDGKRHIFSFHDFSRKVGRKLGKIFGVS